MGSSEASVESREARWRAAGLVGSLVAFLTLGLLGAFRYSDTYAHYRGFAPPNEPATTVVRGAGEPSVVPVVKGSLERIFVTSAAIGGRVQPVWVYLPPGYAQHPSRRYPVMYLLHGFPGNPESFIDVARVWLAEDLLVAQQRMAPMIEVMPFGSTSLIRDQEWANGIAPGSGWETFLAQDVVHAIDTRFRTLAFAQGRAIAGLSEGGYGALNIALHHPAEFGVIESWSGYMLASPIPRIFGRDQRILDQNSPMLSVAGASPILRAEHAFIWFYVGTDDKLLRENQQFATELGALGIAHSFFTSSGAHSWGLWRRFVDQALIVAANHLAGG